MHYLHCILVQVSDAIKDATNLPADEVIDAVRDFAEEETAEFGDGDVFDWRETNTAGRWSESFPCNVILGKNDPEEFEKLFLKYAAMPKNQALSHLYQSYGTDLKFRTRVEMEQDGAVPTEMGLDYLVNHQTQDHENIRYYSAVLPDKGLEITPEFLMGTMEAKYDMRFWHLRKAISMADGKYHSDSYFYSASHKESLIVKDEISRILETKEDWALVFFDQHN